MQIFFKGKIEQIRSRPGSCKRAEGPLGRYFSREMAYSAYDALGKYIKNPKSSSGSWFGSKINLDSFF